VPTQVSPARLLKPEFGRSNGGFGRAQPLRVPQVSQHQKPSKRSESRSLCTAMNLPSVGPLGNASEGLAGGVGLRPDPAAPSSQQFSRLALKATARKAPNTQTHRFESGHPAGDGPRPGLALNRRMPEPQPDQPVHRAGPQPALEAMSQSAASRSATAGRVAQLQLSTPDRFRAVATGG